MASPKLLATQFVVFTLLLAGCTGSSKNPETIAEPGDVPMPPVEDPVGLGNVTTLISVREQDLQGPHFIQHRFDNIPEECQFQAAMAFSAQGTGLESMYVIAGPQVTFTFYSTSSGMFRAYANGAEVSDRILVDYNGSHQFTEMTFSLTGYPGDYVWSMYGRNFTASDNEFTDGAALRYSLTCETGFQDRGQQRITEFASYSMHSSNDGIGVQYQAIEAPIQSRQDVDLGRDIIIFSDHQVGKLALSNDTASTAYDLDGTAQSILGRSPFQGHGLLEVEAIPAPPSGVVPSNGGYWIVTADGMLDA